MLTATLTMQRNCGFALIEALVTAFVLAFGLMGLAALQMASTKNTYSAEKRSEASMLANDITDRMRANRPAVQSGSYDIAIGGSPPSCTNCQCSSIADSDLCQWKAWLAGTLPSGDGSIARSGNVATVTIRWDDSLGLDGSSSEEFVFETRL